MSTSTAVLEQEEEAQGSAAAEPKQWWRQWWRSGWWRRTPAVVIWPNWRTMGWISATYLGAASITLLVFLKIVDRTGYPLREVPRRWDGGWYLDLAQYGYDSEITYRANGQVAETNLAFFPGLPALIRAVHTVTGLSYQRSALVISLISVLIAAVGIHTLVRSMAGERAAYFAVAIWAVLPNAVLEWMPYTEGLATATVVWALVALLDQRWVLAGAITFASGLVRSTATTLIAVVCLAALIAIIRRKGGWRPWVGGLLAPLGLLTSWSIIAAYGDRWDAWWKAQEGWEQHFDFGSLAWGMTKDVLYSVIEDPAWQIVPFVMLFAVVCVVALCFDRRVPWELVLLVVLTIFLAWGSAASFSSKPRFLLPVAPILFLPIASSLARSKIVIAIAVIGMLGIIAGWYGYFSLVDSAQAP